MNFRFFRQPKYYGEFKCIGSECKANCCYGWRIDWSKDEVDKVKNAPNCPADIKEIFETHFIPVVKSDVGELSELELEALKSAKDYAVKFDEHGKCPCLTDEGLCRVQKEMGAEYLSRTCMIYPRYNSFVEPGYAIYRGCFLSCPEIIRKITTDEKAMELVNIPVEKEAGGSKTIKQSIKHGDVDADLKNHPELKYRSKIADFFYELIGDKKCSVETNIILGALAAQKLTQLVELKEYDRIPEALKGFRKQIHNAAALKSINDIKPNYNVKFGVADKITGALKLNATEWLKNKNGELDITRYLLGEEMLQKMMKDNPFWLRHIAQSLILEMSIPFYKPSYTIFENYSFYVASISCIKLIAVCAGFSPNKMKVTNEGVSFELEGVEKLYNVIGMMCRRYFQNLASFGEVIGVLKEFGMNSPAYLALLIK